MNSGNHIALSIKDLSIKVGAKSLLIEGSLQIQRGKITGIFGKSGSGKSIFCQSLLDISPIEPGAVGGEIKYIGPNSDSKRKDITIDFLKLSIGRGFRKEFYKNMRFYQFELIRDRSVSYIFQERGKAWDPKFTIKEHFDELKSNGEDQQLLSEKLKQRLWPRDKSEINKPGEFSGGEIQRIHTILSLSKSPEILILDEATTNLDPINEKLLLDTIQNLVVEKGLTVLIISHSYRILRHYADVVYELSPQRKFELKEKDTLGGFSKKSISTSKKNSKDRVTLLKLDSYTVKLKKVKKGEREKILNNIKLSLATGETLGIIGESGAGKTTLLNMVGKLMTGKDTPFSTTGQIIYSNEQFNLDTHSGEQIDLEFRSFCQTIFQHPDESLNIYLKPKTLFMEAYRLHHSKEYRDARKIHNPLYNYRFLDQKVKGLLKEYGLYEYLLIPNTNTGKIIYQEKIKNLSGGEKRLVGIARVLLAEPSLILIDEPLAGLDRDLKEIAIESFLKLKEHGKSLIITSHDFELIRKTCDRVVVFNNGELLEEGSCYEVLDNPKHEYSQELVKAGFLE